jgi:hypothetical protein
MFPLSARDSIRISCESSLSTADVIANVAQEIKKWKPSTCEVLGDSVCFEGGLLRFVASTNLLVAITRGSVRVSTTPDGVALQYELTFVQTAACGTVLALFLSSQIPASWVVRGLMFLAFWYWVVGVNYLVTKVRFQSMLRKSVSISATTKPP